MEYPKALYLKGFDDLEAFVTVRSKDEESDARQRGYKMLGEAHAVQEGQAPTEEVKKRGRPRKVEQ